MQETQSKTIESEEVTVICPHCAEQVTEQDHLCPHCGGPITAHAMIDPMARIYAIGNLLGRYHNEPPKRITVIGAWLFLGPQIPFLILLLCLTFMDLFLSEASISTGGSVLSKSHQSPWLAVIQILIYSFFLICVCRILWQVTKGFMHRKSAGLQSDDQS